MRCPSCDHGESKVIDSRAVGDGDAIRRRRECERCGERFTTYERVEEVVPRVVKKDGRRVEFDKAKINRGVRLACNKRRVEARVIDQLVDDIAARIQNANEREITSERIGDMVAEELRRVDEVAFVRFLSVYRRFDDTEEFRKALDQLEGSRKG